MLREEGGLGLQRFTIRMRCAWLVGSGSVLEWRRRGRITIFVPALRMSKRTRKDRYLFSIDTHGQTDVPPPTHHHPSMPSPPLPLTTP
jgi:hypothetical protein